MRHFKYSTAAARYFENNDCSADVAFDVAASLDLLLTLLWQCFVSVYPTFTPAFDYYSNYLFKRAVTQFPSHCLLPQVYVFLDQLPTYSTIGKVSESFLLKHVKGWVSSGSEIMQANIWSYFCNLLPHIPVYSGAKTSLYGNYLLHVQSSSKRVTFDFFDNVSSLWEPRNHILIKSIFKYKQRSRLILRGGWLIHFPFW